MVCLKQVVVLSVLGAAMLASPRLCAQQPAQDKRTTVLSPELAKEEAERAARTPEVAKDLHLPEEDTVMALDTFQGSPELVPLPQQATDLNRETAHAVQKLALNPLASQHRISDLQGERAEVQLHVGLPVIFVRIGGEEAEVTGGGAFTVDTNGQEGRATPGTGDAGSSYVIERVNVHAGMRELDSFGIAKLGNGQPQRDVIELRHEDLPGGDWLKLTPVEPLLPGEYALVEIVSGKEVNLDVWDFGVHAEAPENMEAQRPEPKRPIELHRRTP
jgi:hypothetical protein